MKKILIGLVAIFALASCESAQVVFGESVPRYYDSTITPNNYYYEGFYRPNTYYPRYGNGFYYHQPYYRNTRKIITKKRRDVRVRTNKSIHRTTRSSNTNRRTTTNRSNKKN